MQSPGDRRLVVESGDQLPEAAAGHQDDGCLLAAGRSFGLASRMCWTLTVTPLAAMIFLNSSATMAPLPNFEAW
jgi:hypothetical protein